MLHFIPRLQRLFWALLLGFVAILAPLPSPISPSASARSRLQDLVTQPPQAFFPDRLVAGASMPLVLKGPAGGSVTVTLSDDAAKTVLQNETAQLNESGVLRVLLSVPDDKTLVGKSMTVNAMLGTEPFALIGSDGQPRRDARLIVVEAASSGKGLKFMPDLPGMPPGFLQQLNNATTAIEKANQDKGNPDQHASEQPDLMQDNGVRLNNPFVRPGGNAIGTP